ncbi:FtsK/SpoIIIE domain-containing protein [Macrococcus carouselicus]|uniref:DUF87 domain-containing protein n=1 Tax=Macrococcus carouselicus TaxID=69969 RepID=A0A9Q8FQ18_9STAP|nr:FtsK/SpoIIIE domain-containing protein [Macrococcus carouselicus]TDL95512.1 DUF87 domain-containing protein [Macrococcus carouselicus]
MTKRDVQYPYAQFSKRVYMSIRKVVLLTIVLASIAFIFSLLSSAFIWIADKLFKPNFMHDWYVRTNAKNDGAMDRIPFMKYLFPDTSDWSDNLADWLSFKDGGLVSIVLMTGLTIAGIMLLIYVITIILRHHKGEMAPFLNDIESVKLKKKIIRSIGAGIWDIYDESDRKLKRVEHGARYHLRKMKVDIHTTLDKGQPKPTKKYSVVIRKPRKITVNKLVLHKIKDLQDILTDLTDGVSFDQMKVTANRRYYTYGGSVEKELKEARSVVRRRERAKNKVEQALEVPENGLTFPIEMLNDVSDQVRDEKQKAEDFTESVKHKVALSLSNSNLQTELIDTFVSSKTAVLKYSYSYTKNHPSDDRIAKSVSDELKIEGVTCSSSAGSLEITVPFSDKGINAIQIPIDFKNIVEKHIAGNKKLKPTDTLIGVLPNGDSVIKSLASAPHLLVVGTTGSGKSVGLNILIMTMLAHNTPDNVQLIIIDPKKVEFPHYNDSPYMVTNPITEVEDGAIALEYAVIEMENRYKLLEQYKVKNIEAYNKLAAKDSSLKKMKYLFIVIDEFSDFKDSLDDFKAVEKSIRRLGQKARACGIHLILATQSPRSEVITGIIKANLPMKIAFAVSSRLESSIALDDTGDSISADKLLGRGDMLIKIGSSFTRAQGAYLSDEEIINITTHWREKFDKPVFVDYKSIVARESGDEMSSEKEEMYSAVTSLQQTRTDAKKTEPRMNALEKAEERKEAKKERAYKVDMSKYFKDVPPPKKRAEKKVDTSQKTAVDSSKKDDNKKTASDILGI